MSNPSNKGIAFRPTNLALLVSLLLGNSWALAQGAIQSPAVKPFSVKAQGLPEIQEQGSRKTLDLRRKWSNRLVIQFGETEKLGLVMDSVSGVRLNLLQDLAGATGFPVEVVGQLGERFLIVELPLARNDRDMQSALSSIARLPGILTVEPDLILRRSVDANSFNDPGWARFFNAVSGNLAINARLISSVAFNPRIAELAEYLIQNPSVSPAPIAVVDSGYVQSVDSQSSTYTHEATILQGRFSAGAVEQTSTFSHGSSVAGIITSPRNNGYGVGSIGQFPVSMIRVFPSNGATALSTDVALGIRYAVNRHAASLTSSPNPAPAKVVNLSLGSDANTGDLCASFIQEAIDTAINSGAVVVAAAGNEAVQGLSVPANCAGVVSVGAVNHAGFSSDYSNVSSGLITSTFGGDQSLSSVFPVLNPLASNGVGASQGTSNAAPVISAFVSVAMGLDGRQTPDSIRSLIRSTGSGYASGGFCQGTSNCGPVFNALGFMQNFGVDLTQTGSGGAAPAPNPSPTPTPSPSPAPTPSPSPGTDEPAAPAPVQAFETPKGYTSVQVVSFTTTGAIESVRRPDGSISNEIADIYFDQGRVVLRLSTPGEFVVFFNNGQTGSALRRFGFRIRKSTGFEFDIGETVVLQGNEFPPPLSSSLTFDGQERPTLQAQEPVRLPDQESPSGGLSLNLFGLLGLWGALAYSRIRLRLSEQKSGKDL